MSKLPRKILRETFFMGFAEETIDVVITWVDGNDPSYRKSKYRILQQEPATQEAQLVTGRDDTRFLDNGELRFCIVSIRIFAPWIRRIYLVTDNQTPAFLSKKIMDTLNISVVDHKDIFKDYTDILPTFNNRTIETALWRIPGISERFIYFNDDFILTRDVSPEDFYSGDKVILRGEWNSFINYSPLRLKLNDYFSLFMRKIGVTRSMHLLQQILSAKYAGFMDKYYRAPHVPHPIRKSTLETYFERHPEHFSRNISYKIRNKNQFSAIFLANHLEIKANNALFKDADDALMINGEMDLGFILEHKLNKVKRAEYAFLCLQAFEKFNESQKNKISQTLWKYFNEHVNLNETPLRSLLPIQE